MVMSRVATSTIMERDEWESERNDERKSEELELLATIKEIMHKTESTPFFKEKKKFENDLYTYSLCDDYKSRKAEKVVSYMLHKKNVNILYYTDDYKYIIFVNFLRWCQLLNLSVKKYHDLFLKYDISVYSEYEQIFQFFLKPAIDNDRLLWDVDREEFAEYMVTRDTTEKKENEKEEEKEKEKEKEKEEEDAIKKGNAGVDSMGIKNLISNDKSEDSSNISSSNSSTDNELESEHESESEMSESEYELQLKHDLGYNSKCDLVKGLSKRKGEDEKGYVSNKRKAEKEIIARWNNLHLNNLVETIIMKRNKNEDKEKDENKGKKKEYEETTSEALIKKFVSTSDNEEEDIKNLQTKVSSMETIIKYLITEILRKDMTQNLYIGGTNMSNNSIIKSKDQETKKVIDIDKEHTTSNCKKENDERSKEIVVMEKGIEEGDEKEEADKTYFRSYNFLEIHRIMILDKVRTNSYYEFINKNKNLFRGKTVLDVGCGSGVISLFCSDFCKTVVGVDNAENILNKAEKIIKNNEATNIFLFKGKLEEHTIYIDEKGKIYFLPTNVNIKNFENNNNVKLELFQFDIIISEWMGYFLFYECMIDTIIHARNVYLKKGGYIFPNKINLYVSGYDDTNYWKENIQVWENKIYGKCFKELKPDVKNFLQNGKIIKTNKNNIVTDMVHYYTIDLYKYERKDSYIYTTFQIPIKKNTIISSLCFHFDCIFEAVNVQTLENMSIKDDTLVKNEKWMYEEQNNVGTISNYNIPLNSIINPKENCNSSFKETFSHCVLSTNPLCEQTHWKQTLLHLYDPDCNLLNISSTAVSFTEDVNSNSTSKNVSNTKEQEHSLNCRICIAPGSKYTRNLFVVLQLDKNESIAIKDNMVCYYNIN